MICEKCNKEFDLVGKFCPNCGAEIPEDIIKAYNKEQQEKRRYTCFSVIGLITGILGLVYNIIILSVVTMDFDFELFLFLNPSVVAIAFGFIGLNNKDCKSRSIAAIIMGFIGATIYTSLLILNIINETTSTLGMIF